MRLNQKFILSILPKFSIFEVCMTIVLLKTASMDRKANLEKWKPHSTTHSLFTTLEGVGIYSKKEGMSSPCYEWNCTNSKFLGMLCRWCLPYIIIPGVPKSGTSEMFDLLMSHPSTRQYCGDNGAKEINIITRHRFSTLASNLPCSIPIDTIIGRPYMSRAQSRLPSLSTISSFSNKNTQPSGPSHPSGVRRNA